MEKKIFCPCCGKKTKHLSQSETSSPIFLISSGAIASPHMFLNMFQRQKEQDSYFKCEECGNITKCHDDED